MASSILRKSLEQAKLLSNSGLLDKAWSKILTHGFQDVKTYEEGIYTIVVFAAPNRRLDSAASTFTGPEAQNQFHFLCSENVPSFSLHKTAFELFVAAGQDNLIELRSKLLGLLKSKKQVIITGAALGGSVASVFTLWLLEKVEPEFKRPLCITFGSPLIGDASLQQNLENSLWNSCFLHVADAAQTPIQAGFKPFGTFLICGGIQCICIDDPETVMELLVAGANADEVVVRDYGEVLGRLVQPLAVDSRLGIDDGIIKRMVERAENKKPRYDPLRKLVRMKILMVGLERYKKKCKEFKMGFYDWYRAPTTSEVKMDIERLKKELNGYWKELVEEVRKMPQSEKVLKKRSLFAANNYRRMVEPLDIAEYYRLGGKEYRTTVRSPHYETLQKWFKAEVKEEPERPHGSDLSDLLTFDSCFWADVEEAMPVTIALRTQGVGREELPEELIKFEKKVWEMIDKREVSPEIFLEGSSFMKWWRAYKEIKGSSSDFTTFMNNEEYKSYGQAR
ncbi:Senescence-associated carboxylesterase 101 [Hirschfeldia incana]|nr:Senescence-associated carboxylesterase 101 [Hirschfeldia incana]